jgi:hypothetical protein
VQVGLQMKVQVQVKEVVEDNRLEGEEEEVG